MTKINKKQTNRLSALKLKADKLKISTLCRTTAILLSVSILSPANYPNNYGGNTANNYQGKVDLRQVIMDRRDEIQTLSQNDLEKLTSGIRTQFNDPYCAKLIQDIWNANTSYNRDIGYTNYIQQNLTPFNVPAGKQKGSIPVQFNQPQANQFLMPGPENFLADPNRANQIIKALNSALYTNNQDDSDNYEDSKFTLGTETSVDSNFTLSASETPEKNQYVAMRIEEEEKKKANLQNRNSQQYNKAKAGNNSFDDDYDANEKADTKKRKILSDRLYLAQAAGNSNNRAGNNDMASRNAQISNSNASITNAKKGVDIKNPNRGQNSNSRGQSNQSNGCESSCSA